jgi:protoheme IX farnesyltransferase
MGVVSAASGLVVLASGTNLLTAGLSLFVIVLYVLVYTPLKVRTPFATLVGAVCGAIPPMMGWTAATGRLDIGSWILFGILFCWQVPHFLALAWLYRDDYERGGFRMLPAVDASGRATGSVAFAYAMALVPLGVFVFLEGLAGWAFLAGSLGLGFMFSHAAWRMAAQRSHLIARRLFLASLVYLPLLLGMMVLDIEQGLLRLVFRHSEVDFVVAQAGQAPPVESYQWHQQKSVY